MLALHFIWDVAGRLADDLDIADYGIDRFLVDGKGCTIETGSVASNALDRVENILNPQLLVSRRHRQPLGGCGHVAGA